VHSRQSGTHVSSQVWAALCAAASIGQGRPRLGAGPARGLTVGSGVVRRGPGRRLCRPVAPRPGGASRTRHGGSASEPRPPRSASSGRRSAKRRASVSGGGLADAPSRRARPARRGRPATSGCCRGGPRCSWPRTGSPASSSVLPCGRARRAVRDARGVPRCEPLALRYGTPVRSRICAQVTRSSRYAAARRTQRLMPRATTGPFATRPRWAALRNRPGSDRRQTEKQTRGAALNNSGFPTAAHVEAIAHAGRKRAH
jgi:hypothetical protein